LYYIGERYIIGEEAGRKVSYSPPLTRPALRANGLCPGHPLAPYLSARGEREKVLKLDFNKRSKEKAWAFDLRERSERDERERKRRTN
jgi:hypothetical protein